MQTTSHLLMIRPARFGYNPETAVNNAFQQKPLDDAQSIQEKALREFDGFVNVLRVNGVDITVVQDSPSPHTPDSIFPNNWVSFHDDGAIYLYPMFALNRRQERKPEVLEEVKKKFLVTQTHDLTPYENETSFLEGTGSMVLDRDNKIAYACLSERTHPDVLESFCEISGYRPVAFYAIDQSGKPIYHTNVMMCVADRYVVICLEAIPDDKERELVMSVILASGKEIVEISLDQVNHFAGNMLQVENQEGKKLLVMSTQAWSSLLPNQVEKLTQFNPIIHSSLETIEANGGGSARCMMAEIHNPRLG